MKKIISLILAMGLLFSLAACGKGDTEPTGEAQNENVQATESVETSGEPSDRETADAQGDPAKPTMPPESETVQKAKNAPEGENRFAFSGISLILPEGFQISNTPEAVMAYAKDGPERGDVINFARGEAIDAGLYTKELLDESLKQNLPGYTGMKRYETGKTGDTDSILMGYDIAENDTTFHITQLLLFYPDRSLALTFNDMTGTYTKDFEKSIKSIEKEQ